SECAHCTPDHGDPTEDDEEFGDEWDETVGRNEACHEINASFDHRGRVQVCTHGSRCGHCTWKPEVERENCRLCECTDENERNRSDERARQFGWAAQHRVE